MRRIKMLLWEKLSRYDYNLKCGLGIKIDSNDKGWTSVVNEQTNQSWSTKHVTENQEPEDCEVPKLRKMLGLIGKCSPAFSLFKSSSVTSFLA